MLAEIPASELAQREALLRAEILGGSMGSVYNQPVPMITHPSGGGSVSHPTGPIHYSPEPAGVAGPIRPLAGSVSLSTVTPEGSKLYSVNFLTGVVETSLGSFVLGEDEIAKVAYVALLALDRNLSNVLSALAREHGVDKLLAGAENATAPASNPVPAPAAPLDPETMQAALAQLADMAREGRGDDGDEVDPPAPDPKPTPQQIAAAKRRARKS